MKLMMIRHPITLANIQGIVQHEVEGDIAPKGYEQIQELLRRLQSDNFDNCYSSDAHRCKVLAEEISQYKDIPVYYSSLFREINNGVWNGNRKVDIERLSLADPINTKPEGGESLQDLVNRSTRGLDIIISRGGERNILISHGWFLKTLLGLQFSMNPIEAIKILKFSNCAISEIELKEQGCLVEYLNNRDYLTK